MRSRDSLKVIRSNLVIVRKLSARITQSLSFLISGRAPESLSFSRDNFRSRPDYNIFYLKVRMENCLLQVSLLILIPTILRSFTNQSILQFRLKKLRSCAADLKPFNLHTLPLYHTHRVCQGFKNKKRASSETRPLECSWELPFFGRNYKVN